jgi:hypothetical protein
MRGGPLFLGNFTEMRLFPAGGPNGTTGNNTVAHRGGANWFEGDWFEIQPRRAT